MSLNHSATLTAILNSIQLVPADHHISILLHINRLLSKSLGKKSPCLFRERCRFKHNCWFSHNDDLLLCRQTQTNTPNHVSTHSPYATGKNGLPAEEELDVHSSGNFSKGTVPSTLGVHTGPSTTTSTADKYSEHSSADSSASWTSVRRVKHFRQPKVDLPDQTKRCKDCQSTFELEQAAAQWFLDRGLHLPLRCKQCRAAKKKHHQNVQSAQPAKVIQYHQGRQISEAKAWHPQVQAASLLFPSNDSKDPADNPTHCRSNFSPEEVTFQKNGHVSLSEHSLPLLNTRAVGESKEKRSEPRVPPEPIQDDIGPTPAEEKVRLDFHESSDNSDEFRAASEPKGRFWDNSSTDNEPESVPSAASAPPTYWTSRTMAIYDSPNKQCQLFEDASLHSASDCLPALESSSNSGADEHDLAHPHDQANSITAPESPSNVETDKTGSTLPLSDQFQVDDKRLKSRLWQLLHNRPTYSRLMARAWVNVVHENNISCHTNVKYKAWMAIQLVREYEHLRRTEPHLIG